MSILNRFRLFTAVWILAVAFVAQDSASAHFIWLVPSDDGGQVNVYFSEAAVPDDPELLNRLKGISVWQIPADGEPQQLKATLADDSLTVSPANDGNSSVFLAVHEYGLFSRGEATFLLRYYAKTGPQLDAKAWQQKQSQKLADLDIVATPKDSQVEMQILWQGKPLADAEVVVDGPGMKGIETTSDKLGLIQFSPGKGGLYSIRARHIEPRSGSLDGKDYANVRHYATLALGIPSSLIPMNEPTTSQSRKLPDLPQAVTSFGGAIAGDYLYVYGGHTGSAHSYSAKEQGNELRRLSLQNPRMWESVAKGPHLQGLALVAHNGQLYRVGGFAAKNAEGEEHDLWSRDDVARFDPATNKWSELPSLPEPRSSHDVAVLGDKLYVVGGWQLNGGSETKWHSTAWVLDVSAESPTWERLPDPPFHRRALALAAHDGKLYVIGGMQEEGGPTTQVAVFDPASGAWSEGPSLQGKPMEGFGASAFATGGHLYVSTIEGNLQRLVADGKSWEIVQKLPTARFFHRMLPTSDHGLLFVGGANMSSGKFTEVEVINLR